MTPREITYQWIGLQSMLLPIEADMMMADRAHLLGRCHDECEMCTSRI